MSADNVGRVSAPRDTLPDNDRSCVTAIRAEVLNFFGSRAHSTIAIREILPSLAV